MQYIYLILFALTNINIFAVSMNIQELHKKFDLHKQIDDAIHSECRVNKSRSKK